MPVTEKGRLGNWHDGREQLWGVLIRPRGSILIPDIASVR